jgi:hypothetical protein
MEVEGADFPHLSGKILWHILYSLRGYYSIGKKREKQRKSVRSYSCEEANRVYGSGAKWRAFCCPY